MANVEHNVLTDPELHEPKGIAAASANHVYVADGATSGTMTQITPSNHVMVHSASDLPTAVAGVRTLVASTVYRLVGTIDIGSDTIVLSAGCSVEGSSPFLDGLVTTSTGALFTATNVNFTVRNCFLTCASGAAFSLTGASTEVALFEFVRITSCDTIATIAAYSILTMNSCLVLACATSGVTFTGANGDLRVSSGRYTNAAGDAFDLGTATFDLIEFTGVDFQNASGATGIDIAAAGANLNSDKVGHINNCHFLTGATATNYVAGDVGWIVSGTPDVPPSSAVAQGYIVDSALTTTFSGTGAGNEVIVNFGTAWLDSLSYKFTVTTAGVYTYTGVDPIDVFTQADIYATVSGGAARTYNFYWRKNSTTDLSSVSQIEYDGTLALSNSCSTIESMVTGDTLALYVRAETATTTLTVDTVSIKIIQLGS
jgi:hypothetical protein